jgi:hypothetical protein
MEEGLSLLLMIYWQVLKALAIQAQARREARILGSIFSLIISYNHNHNETKKQGIEITASKIPQH